MKTENLECFPFWMVINKIIGNNQSKNKQLVQHYSTGKGFLFNG